MKNRAILGVLALVMILSSISAFYGGEASLKMSSKLEIEDYRIALSTRDNYPIWSDDFESGEGNWGKSGGWVGLTTSASHSPTHSETDSNGAYSTLVDMRLYMNVDVDLSGYSEAYLIFWHKYDFEQSWDGGIVEYSTNGGSSWTQLDSSNSQHVYDGQLYGGYGNVLSNKYAFTGTQSTFKEETFDISSLCGQSAVRFAFRMGSDNYATSDDGWYIDDVMIAIPNQLPNASIVSVSPTVVLRDETVTFDGTGSDADGSVVAYEWDFEGDGTWDYSDPNTGSTTHAYDTIGTYYPKFRVKDDKGAYSNALTFSTGIIVHTRPQCSIDAISPSPAQSGYTVTFNASASDEDGDQIITYVWTSNIDGELYNGSSPTFSTNSLTIGTHTITLKVEDQYHVWSLPVSAQLVVASAPVANILSITPSSGITQGDNVTLSGSGTDPNGESIISYEWYALCAGVPELLASGSDKANITVNTLKPGENTIYFRVQNNNGFWSPFDSRTITVNPMSGAPTATISSPSSGEVFEVGSTITFQGSASGGSGTIEEYRWGHVNQKVDTDFGLLSMGNATISTNTLMVGVHTVYFQVKDSSGSWSVPASIDVDVDTRPVITYYNPSQPTLTIDEGDSIVFNITARDADYDTLTYAWEVNSVSQPAGGPLFTFDTSGNYDSQGTYTITVTVSDGPNRLTAQHTWTLNVENVNQPPQIDSYEPNSAVVTIKEGDSITFSVTASDIDEQFGDVLSYQWYMNSQELQGETDSSYIYTAGYDDEGRYEIMIKVTAGGDEVSHSWTLKVENRDRKPYITSYYPLSTDLDLTVDSVQKFSVNATDMDSTDINRLSFFWYLDDELLPVSDPEFILVCNSTLIGDHVINFTVADAAGELTGVEWNIHVSDVDHVPVILSKAPNPGEMQEVNEGESISFSVTAYDPDDDLDGNGNIDDGYPAGEPNYDEKNNLTFTWKVNGEVQHIGYGNGGGIWSFQPPYTGPLSSEGSPLTVEVVISDGFNTVSVEWQVSVVNVNRKPVIVIDSPSEGHRTFNESDSIVLDASSTYDPDNETLSFAWYVDDKKKSASAKYTITSLDPGDHVIKLEVSDGIDTNETIFQIKVTAAAAQDVGILPVEISPPAPVSGKVFMVKLKVENNGATPATFTVNIMEDGSPVATDSVELAGGESKTVSFNITAKYGSSYTAVISDSSGTPLKTVNLNVNPQKEAVNYDNKEEGMEFSTLVIILTVVGMVIILGSVFAFIKYLDIKEEKEEERRRAEERKRYSQISEEEAQAALEAQIAQAVEDEGGVQQDIVEDGQFVFSNEIYSVEPSAEVYNPEATGEITPEGQEDYTAAEEPEMVSVGSDYPGEEGTYGEESYDASVGEGEEDLDNLFGSEEVGGGEDEIDGLFEDGGGASAPAEERDELDDLFD